MRRNSTNPPLRAAVLGCGRIGADGGAPEAGRSRMESHAAAYVADPRTELVALCDPDAATLTRAQARWKVERGHADVATLLAAERPAIVSICTPTNRHVATLEAALACPSVRAVVLEKPVAGDLADADRALAAAARSDAVVAVAHARRFVPAYQAWARRVRDGALGTVQDVRVLYTNGVVNNGTHAFDILRMFFGDPRRIEPDGASGGAGTDPTLGAVVHYDGFDARLVPLDADAANVFEVDIVGTEGRLRFADVGHVSEYTPVEDTRPAHGFRQLSRPSTESTGLSRAMHHVVADVLDAVATKRPPACTLADGRAALALALQIRDPR